MSDFYKTFKEVYGISDSLIETANKINESIANGTVETKKHSWGTIKKVNVGPGGKHYSIIMHPEHHEKVSALKDGEHHTFTDETRTTWQAHKKGDDIHFKTTRGDYHTKIKASDLNENIENIDELSKETLKNYIRKSAENLRISGQKQTLADIKLDWKNGEKELKNASKRLIGIRRATDSLTKEDIEPLEELSKDTLKSYIKSASYREAAHSFATKDDRNSPIAKTHIALMNKRKAGIDKASNKLFDKLAKEDTNE